MSSVACSFGLVLLSHCAPPSDSIQGAPVAAPASGERGASAAAPAVAPFDHSDWDTILKQHGNGDRVDYAALKADRAPLDAYLDRVAKLPAEALAKLPRADQMAFWINAYNALTLQTIVDHYPIAASGLSALRFPNSSIRQLDDPWGSKHTIAGAQRSLDDIEHKILRAEWKDARIHAAVNCASVGCPPLRLEAFTGEQLETQLDEQMRQFVADPLRNKIDPAQKKIELSPIFDWFGEDFGTKAGGKGSTKESERALLAWLEKYGKPEWKEFLASFDPDDVDFLDYDWTLNEVVR
ncbi:MAG: DUF547 domain-containing protein [Myxococcales bacterium]|nr:DUF547 domain-containing protein [Myxococcales bacterium]